MDGFEVQKKNSLPTSYKPCVKDAMAALEKANGDATLKCERLALGVQHLQLQGAQTVPPGAGDAGSRNWPSSGNEERARWLPEHRRPSSSSKPKGKTDGDEYIDFLLQIGNKKMEGNEKRIERFYNCPQHALERETYIPTRKIIPISVSKKTKTRKNTWQMCY